MPCFRLMAIAQQGRGEGAQLKVQRKGDSAMGLLSWCQNDTQRYPHRTGNSWELKDVSLLR